MKIEHQSPIQRLGDLRVSLEYELSKEFRAQLETRVFECEEYGFSRAYALKKLGEEIISMSGEL